MNPPRPWAAQPTICRHYQTVWRPDLGKHQCKDCESVWEPKVKPPTYDAMKEGTRRHASNFEMFTRNARWGTCGSCPRDGAGKALPEVCRDTERGDHWLKLPDLVEQVYIEARQIDKLREQRENCTCGAMQCSYCMSR